MAQYDDDTRSVGHHPLSNAVLDAEADRRGVDPNNKTASIRSRHSGKRLTAFELEDIFARQGSSPDGASPEPKPVVVPPPKMYASPTEQKVARMKGRVPANGSASLSRARSTPSLVSPQSPGIYSHHVTRVELSDDTSHPDGRVVYNRNLQDSPGGSPGYQRAGIYHVAPNTDTPENLYAVPMKGPRRTGSADNVIESNGGYGTPPNVPPHPREAPPRPPTSPPYKTAIPPPPTHPPPEPPSDHSPAGEVVKISTGSPTYANISQQIQEQQAMKRQTSYESSFRPGIIAKLNKEPVALPPGAGLARLPQSVSSSSSISATSEQYDRTPTSGYKSEHHVITSNTTSNISPARSPQVVHPGSQVSDNAARFLHDHPNASVLVTSETATAATRDPTPPRTQYYEPEPDYDTVYEANTRQQIRNQNQMPEVVNRQHQQSVQEDRSFVETDVPSVHSIRESWKSKDTSSDSKKVPSSPQPTSVNQEENVMSAFGNAIKVAAESREKRRMEQEDEEMRIKAAPPPPPLPAAKRSPPTPPPGPPPPPLPATSETPPLALKKSHVPPQVQKSFEENRQREDTHAAILAAVARRRNMVESADMVQVADSIETRVQRAKKLQSTVYKSDKGKEVTSPTSAVKPTPLLSTEARTEKLNQSPKPPPRTPTVTAATASVAATPPKTKTTVESSVKTTEVVKSKAVEMEDKPEKMQRPPEEVKSPAGGAVSSPVPDTRVGPSQESSIATTEVRSTDPTNFTAMAERARQEWLMKKSGQTLERKKKQESKPDETNEEEKKKEEDDADNNNVTKSKGRAPPIPVRQDHSGNRSGNNQRDSPSQSTVGDLASIIAQKALARQKSQEGTVDGKNGNANGSVGNGYQQQQLKSTPGQNVAAIGVNTNGNNRNGSLVTRSRHSVEIQGATIDSSNTEQQLDKSGRSVLARTQMFESQKTFSNISPNTAPKPAGNRKMYRASELQTDLPIVLPPPAFGDDMPPPMVPPPPPMEFGMDFKRSDLDIVTNGHSKNGHETVGWIINSNSPKVSQEYAILNKLSHRNGSRAVDVDSGDVSALEMVGHEEFEMQPSMAHIVEADFIPPPPLFDSAEMNAVVGFDSIPYSATSHHEETASLVSSLSTLSTLSSNEQEVAHSSPGQSYRSSFASNAPPSGLTQSDAAPPPPPGFDDFMSESAPIGYVDMTTEPEHHYEELTSVNDFIPPPMGFDAAPPSDPQPVTSLRNVMKRNGFQEKPIESWSTSDVCEWLDSIQLGELKSNFARNNVTGRQLVQMGRNELISLGVTQVGDRMSIERAIKQAMMNR